MDVLLPTCLFNLSGILLPSSVPRLALPEFLAGPHFLGGGGPRGPEKKKTG